MTNPKLQDILLGTPLKLIKNKYSLFFVYDPRGYNKKNLPNGYCRACCCPKNYCAEVVYGKICAFRVEFLVNRNVALNVDEDKIVKMFDEVYSINIYAHLMRYSLKFDKELKMNIPHCMRMQSMKRLVKN